MSTDLPPYSGDEPPRPRFRQGDRISYAGAEYLIDQYWANTDEYAAREFMDLMGDHPVMLPRAAVDEDAEVIELGKDFEEGNDEHR